METASGVGPCRVLGRSEAVYRASGEAEGAEMTYEKYLEEVEGIVADEDGSRVLLRKLEDDPEAREDLEDEDYIDETAEADHFLHPDR